MDIKYFSYEFTIGENSKLIPNWFFPNKRTALNYVYNYYRQKYDLNQPGI